ncbi:MAG: aromatic amino acid ammonia-lyase [bacterium]|nr:aromatic amino acid ammonia-lyase [bacterium]
MPPAKLKKRNTLVLDGGSLTPEMVSEFVADKTTVVSITPDALKKVRDGNAFLNREVGKNVIYGITTGFGPMASHVIGKNQLEELQYNLVRSHAVGAGKPIPEDFVLAAMLDRLNTFLKGHSGVSEGLTEQLTHFINRRIIPIVPRHGAVGASGDLVQLAHIALALIGEGEVSVKGKRMPAKAALKKFRIRALKLGPKEGIALINGTSFMTGIAALVVCRAEHLLNTTIEASALAFELVNGITDAVSDGLSAVRPHVGQREIARRLRTIIETSKLVTDRKKLQSRVSVIDNVYITPEQIQDVYSFRCVPQILGPVFDILQKVKNDVTIELNSVTDNPIIDLKEKTFLHGGNFHGEYVAQAMDQLKIGIIKLTMLSERRINFFLNRNVNQTFPPFLNLNQPGLTLALQGVQFVATSTTAGSQSLGYPHSLHSISTNADNQDVVSMGTDAAFMTAKVIENAYTVLAIELITLAQAVDVLKVGNKLSAPSRALYSKVRKTMPVVIEDRSFSSELNELIRKLKKGEEEEF